MSIKEERYFIASVQCYQVKAFNGNVMIKEDCTAWLSEDRGYPELSSRKRDARHFNEPISEEDLKKWDGMPWYYRIKPGTLQVFEVYRKVETTIVETPVDPN